MFYYLDSSNGLNQTNKDYVIKQKVFSFISSII